MGRRVVKSVYGDRAAKATNVAVYKYPNKLVKVGTGINLWASVSRRKYARGDTLLILTILPTLMNESRKSFGDLTLDVTPPALERCFPQ